MTSQRPAALIVKQLNEFQHELGGILTGFGYEPMPNSIAAVELSSTENAQAIQAAHNSGGILIKFATDQLSAFIRIITEPVLTFAPWTNIRSILEATAISVWLLDETINLNERISRSYAFRCKGLDQRVTFAQATKNPSQLSDAERQRDKVLMKAKGMGLTNYDKNGKIKLISPMPNTTNLVRDYLGEEDTYRLLSAMTHAHLWALIALGLSPVADIPNGKLMEKSLSLNSVGYLTFKALNALQKAIMGKCKLFGWPIEDIKKVFNNKLRTLAVVFRQVKQQ
ncbi:MAG: hypothetical protein PVJ61_05055 [Dehalococcoidia bacterium]|jgi:hypothetical protein